MIAVLALWGYRAIKDEAKAIAEASAKATLAEYMDGQSIQDKLKEEVQKRVAEEADKVFEDIAMGRAFPQRIDEAQPPAVGLDYPEEPQL